MLLFLVLEIVLALLVDIVVADRCIALAVDRRMDSAEDTPTDRYQSLYRVLCQNPAPVLFRIRVSDSCILGQDNQHNSLLLFQSWVLSPTVLFCLLVAFFFTSIFVLMHSFYLCDNAQKYIKVAHATIDLRNRKDGKHHVATKT
jgi:hypothetical protein